MMKLNKTLERVINTTKNVGRVAILASALYMTACTKPIEPITSDKPEQVVVKDSLASKPKPTDSIPTPIKPIQYIPSLPVTFFYDKDVNWVSYAPTNFNPNISQYPSEQSVRDDFKALIAHNYPAIITYGSDSIFGRFPQIAKSEGIKGFVMGIWNPTSKEEIKNAIKAKDFVDGYCVGNEGLLNGRYTLQKLKFVMDSLRTVTNKPVTTTEPSTTYNDELKKLGDWIFPNVHPYWSGITNPDSAAKWTKKQYDNFSANTSRVVIFKEVGLPSAGGNDLSEVNQNQYYNALEVDMNVSSLLNMWAFNSHSTFFSYFEAFDQPWKNTNGVESHWGLFDKDRNEKKVLEPQIMYTNIPAKKTFNDLFGKVRNVIPSQYKTLTYIKVAGDWWVKPYFGSELVTIAPNGSWACDVTTGGYDEEATTFITYLVTSDFNPTNTDPTQLPPNKANDKVKSYVSVNR